MKRQSTTPGFSIVEILIAVIIIGILSSVLVPVLVNRSRDSRLKAAARELQNIANAQERAAIDTGYYYRLYVLDDLPGNRGGDSIAAENVTSVADNIFVNPETNDMLNVSATRLQAIFRQVAETTWGGPYYTIHRDESFAMANETGYTFGVPNDPWGNDYVFVTREGALVEPLGLFLNTYLGAAALGFDRPTIVSLGPDGEPGAGVDGGPRVLGRGDDLYRSFGY